MTANINDYKIRLQNTGFSNQEAAVIAGQYLGNGTLDELDAFIRNLEAERGENANG